MTTAVPVSPKNWSVFAPIVTAALAAIAFAGLAGVATTKHGSPPSRFFRLSLRPPAASIVRAVAPSGASGDMCVMALGTSGKLSVGEAVAVGLTNCDLYNNSHKAASTELIGEASLSARNIFLSGGYALSPGTLM